MARFRPTLALALFVPLTLLASVDDAPAKSRRAREAAPVAEPATPTPAPRAQGDREIQEITLENGLRIFVVERSASPTFAGYYQFQVGGAMDPKGASGIAHLLEHMMFKGTGTLGTLDARKEDPILQRISELWHELHRELDRRGDPFRPADEDRIAALEKEIEDLQTQHKDLVVKNEFDEVMTRAGGVSENASTSNDVTNYFIQLPANRLELWFRMESDRILDPVFREFYSERDVVHEERRTRTENDPNGAMWEALESLVFDAHPYGTPVVGWPGDISRLTSEDAMAYFRTYYSPSNCVMVLVGDVNAAEVERLARKYFGRWKRQDIPRLQVTAELPQKGERRRVVEFDAEPAILAAWPTVRAGAPDEPALEVLSSILGGLASSRLDKTIVQAEQVAAFAGTFHYAQRYGGIFGLQSQPTPGHVVGEIEKGTEREIARIQESGVTADELERAKIQVEAQRVRRMKSNLGQAFEIGATVGLSGTPDYIREYERRLNAVTAEQVQDVAKRYLLPSRKNVIELRKVEGSGGGSEGGGVEHSRGGSPGERGAAHSLGYKAAMTLMDQAPPVKLTTPEIGKDVQRIELPCGTVLFVKEDRTAPSVEMRFAWLGGSRTTPIEDLARFELASQLLTEGGTKDLEPMALKERMEELGMSFSAWMGETGSGASFWSLRRNFDDAFDIAMDVLMEPRFDRKRLDVIRGQHIDGMRRRYDYPSWAVNIVQQHVLHRDHPRLGYQATKAQVEAVTPAQVEQSWRRYLGNDNLHVTVVGDFDAAEMIRKVESRLCAWRPAQDTTRDWLPRPPSIRPGVFVVEKEVSAPAVALIQEIAIDRSAPAADHAAVEVLNDILGGSGFRSRLMERLRSDEGLTYGVGSYMWHEGRPGVPGGIGIGYETKAESVAKSIDSVLDEYRKVIDQTVSAAEVKEQVESWKNRFIFRFTNDFYSVGRLMDQELDDRPYDWDRQVLEQVQQVTVEDVQRVAKAYLKPENVTISIFGKLTDADRAALEKRFTVTVLPKDDVFRGGFGDEPAAVGAAETPPAAAGASR